MMVLSPVPRWILMVVFMHAKFQPFENFMRLKVPFFVLLFSACNPCFACGMLESPFTNEGVSLDYVGKIELKVPNKEWA
jgi:hypothetical protein